MTLIRRPGPLRPDPFSSSYPDRTPGSLGHHDAADPDVVAERGASPGTLGRNDGAEQLAKFYGPGSKGKKRRRPRRSRHVRTSIARELNLYADFTPGPWKTPQEIIRAIHSGKDEWYPGRTELWEFAKSNSRRNMRVTVAGAYNIWNVLGAIARVRPNRVNIFTHAVSGYVSFSGTVVKGNVNFNSHKKDTDFSSQSIDRAKVASFQEKPGAKMIDIDVVRAALPKGAMMVIYACHAGLDTQYLKNVAKLLRIKVYGFSKEIRYYPDRIVDGRIKWKYSVGAGKKVTDYHDLVSDKSASP